MESRIPQCRHWHAAGPAGHARHTDTLTHDYVRGDTLSLLVALNLDTGKFYYACAKRHRHQELLGRVHTMR